MAKKRKIIKKDVEAAKTMPPLGFSPQVDLIDVIDGDTVLVEFKRRFAVRLVHPNDSKLEFNAPEKNTQEGVDAKENLAKILAGKELIIFIPAHNGVSLMDIQSFNRVLATMWAGEELVTEKMLEGGFAALYKKGCYNTKGKE